MRLQGKKALITGGNSGIGFATAQLFIKEGAKVAITGRNQKTLDEAVQQLGPQAIGYRADVSDSAARKELIAKIGKDFGELDIVFANAGIPGQTKAGSTDEAVFEEIIRVNLTGAFFTVESALPLLKDGSSIIFNGSVIGSLGQGGYAAYAASKAGIRAIARSLAADLSPRNIRVNVVSPGATKTPIWSRGVQRPPEEVGAIAERITSTIPLGRWGEAEEIAKPSSSSPRTTPPTCRQ
jgi:NAD(P)-dependent dehydrogenase (short-subunit alcohol dehydrogenase family)